MRSKKDRINHAALVDHMRKMVNEANDLRDEAAKKTYGVPKQYVLITRAEEIRSVVEMIFAMLGLAALFMALYWSSVGDHLILCFIATVALTICAVAISFRFYHPGTMEKRVLAYHDNDAHCTALEHELQRLKAGIAAYNQEFEECYEYIAKFREHSVELNDWGGSIIEVLMPGNFHARVWANTGRDEIDCELKYNEKGYEKLQNILSFLNQQ